MPLSFLFTIVYRDDPAPYDYIGAIHSPGGGSIGQRIQSFGLRFLKQNILELAILEFPTWDQFQQKMKVGWDVVVFSFYLMETKEALEMVDAARPHAKELWAGNYGAFILGCKDWVVYLH